MASGDSSTVVVDRLRRGYLVERELSDRLRNARSSEERRSLYGPVYEEFYRRVPWLSYLQPEAAQTPLSGTPSGAYRLLSRYLRPDSTYMEIGPGNCRLAREVAAHVRQVYAVDVSETVMRSGGELPANVELVISDGCSVPVPAGSVDVAFSQHLMEHLHPDDAREQLAHIYTALKPGGTYLCITPNGTNGPHDISKHFGDPIATGFHLKEYTTGELSSLFRAVGFRKVESILDVKERTVVVSPRIVTGVEHLTRLIPRRIWAQRKHSVPVQVVLLIRLVGTK